MSNLVGIGPLKCHRFNNQSVTNPPVTSEDAELKATRYLKKEKDSGPGSGSGAGCRVFGVGNLRSVSQLCSHLGSTSSRSSGGSARSKSQHQQAGRHHQTASGKACHNKSPGVWAPSQAAVEGRTAGFSGLFRVFRVSVASTNQPGPVPVQSTPSLFPSYVPNRKLYNEAVIV